MLNYPRLEARMCFFVTIAKNLKGFLTKFQSDKPRVSFLFEAWRIFYIHWWNGLWNHVLSKTCQRFKLSFPLRRKCCTVGIDISLRTKLAPRSSDITKRQKNSSYSAWNSWMTSLVYNVALILPLIEVSSCLDPMMMAWNINGNWCYRVLENTLDEMLDGKMDIWIRSRSHH